VRVERWQRKGQRGADEGFHISFERSVDVVMYEMHGNRIILREIERDRMTKV